MFRYFILGAMLACAVSVSAEPFESTYKPQDGHATLILDASILTATHGLIEKGWVYFKDGIIVAYGEGEFMTGFFPVNDAEKIDGNGLWITPGLIDVHSHLGDYPSPAYPPHSDGNESTVPVTAEVWAEHSVWPQDPQFPLALAGGITSLQVLPGSANLIGGRGVTIKNVPGRSVLDMKFPGAPHGMKMACGENPKGVYGNRNMAPSTRMGNVAGYRNAWIEAQAYRRSWKEYEASVVAAEKNPELKPGELPKRDLKLETLVGVLDGEILVHNHCYRADEMVVMMEISKEFGYEIAAFHHATEAYKVADLLAEQNICAAIWADWFRNKLEGFDAIKENAALLEKAGACAVIHSDSPIGIQHLNQEAAKALSAGQAMGLDLDESDAIRWITLNAAKALGIDDRTGSLEPGKMADVVLWNGNPFSVYSRVVKVFIDGLVRYDESSGVYPQTDFELGHRSVRQ